LSDLGVGPALIYHQKEEDATHTAFWLGIGVSFILFAGVFFGAPLLGSFFNDSRAIPVTRALAFTFPIASMGHIHDILLRREMMFGKKFIPDTVKSFGKGLITVILALFGYGSWSLIYGQLAGEVLAVVAYWIVMPWRPKFVFVGIVARKLLSYGFNIVSINAFAVLLNNAVYFLIGRFMGAAALGLFTIAFRIPEILIGQFYSLVSKAVFPFYAKIQDDVEGLRRGYLASSQYITLIVLPVGVGVALVAYPLVEIAFGPEWLASAPVMQAVAFFMIMGSLTYNAGDVYKARGRPDILTKLSVVETIILIPLLYIALISSESIVVVSWVNMFVALIFGVVSVVIACRILEIKYLEVIKIASPAVISSIIMSVAVLAVMSQIDDSLTLIELISGAVVGGITYIGSLWLLQRGLVLQGINILRSTMAGKNARPADN
jgi:O-antigen/teichoic acid export membrane protein